MSFFQNWPLGVSAGGCGVRFIMIPLAIHVNLLSLKISKCLIEKDLQALKNAPGSTRTYCSTGNSVHYYVAACMGGEFGGERIHGQVGSVAVRGCSPETVTIVSVNWLCANAKEKAKKNMHPVLFFSYLKTDF